MFRRMYFLGWSLLLSTAFLSAGFLSENMAFASPQQQKDQDKQTQDKQTQDKQSQDKQIGDDDKFYHGKGINDLNAIGSRNVGCNRGLGNWYTLESQVKMGQQFAQQVEQTSHLITDPVVNEYVNRVGQNLTRNSDSKLPLTIKI
ncbi:MAG TPA: peptidase M48, partial [Candidatus Binatia bacterium]|nr:peptidase M48 [Candidatus Binatia bacterium]